MNDPSVTVTRIAPGTYRVEHDGRNEIVYVTGAVADRWIFWKGHVFRGDWGRPAEKLARPDKVRPTSLAAPMPARVIKILVQPGSAVKKGETLVVLEAMKMETPVVSPYEAVVRAVHVGEGDRVAGGTILVELEE